MALVGTSPSVLTVTRKATSTASPVQVGRYGGLEEEVEHLKRDKNVLMLELVRLRQQQQVQPALLSIDLQCCSVICIPAIMAARAMLAFTVLHALPSVDP